MSRFKKGKGGKKSPVKGGKKSFDPDPHEIEIFQTFQLLREDIEKPDLNVYDPDDFYEFPIISVEWLKKLEEHTKGLEPYPEETVNEDLLEESKHNGVDKVFRWGSKRKQYNSILKSKLKFKKDYTICPEAAWQIIKENYPSIEIYRKFYVEKNSFHQMSVDYESVRNS
jgi:hypothetical protein